MHYAVLSAVLLAASFPALHWHPLAWMALAPLLCAARELGVLRSSRLFFVAGWIFHSIALQWLLSNIHWAGGWAILGQQLVCLYLAAYWAAFGAILVWLRGRGPGWANPLAAAVLWTALEALQARLFTGFGWTALGYTQGGNLWVLQWASLGGVALLSFILVLVNSLMAEAWSNRAWRWPSLIAAAALLLFLHAGGRFLTAEAPAGKPFHVAIFQSNFPQEMKYDPEYLEDMVQKASDASILIAKYRPVDLFVWPEALVMDDFAQPSLRDLLRDFVGKAGRPLFTGSVRLDDHGNYNSSVLIAADGTVQGFYDKMHLAPFGEYLPLASYLPFIREIIMGDVTPGEDLKVFSAGAKTLGPLICFEVLFAPMALDLREAGADVLVVITNLGWFGASNAVAQELEVARMRAVETRLPLVHAANTGISGVFDPWGRFSVIRDIPGRHGYFQLSEHISPEATFLQRMVGSLPVAAPAPHPMAKGPVYFPLGAMAVSVVLLLGAWTAKRWVHAPGKAPD